MSKRQDDNSKCDRREFIEGCAVTAGAAAAAASGFTAGQVQAAEAKSASNFDYKPVDGWAKMPADVRATIEQTARDMQDFVHRTAAKLDIDLLQKLKAGGMVVNQPDRAAFMAANKPIYDEFSSSVAGAGEMIEAALAAEPKQ